VRWWVQPVWLGLFFVSCVRAQPSYSLSTPDELKRDGFPSPVLDATLGGLPARLLVDTGASAHVVTRQFAASGGLKTQKTGLTARDSTGQEIPAETLHADLRAAGTRLPIELAVLDFPRIFQEHAIAGLISPQLLAPAGEAAILDQRRGTLRFAPFEQALRETGARELPGARVCRPEGTAHRLYVVPVQVAGTAAVLELDTGATVSTLVTSSAAGAALLPRARAEGSTTGVAGRPATTARVSAELTFAGLRTAISAQLITSPERGCEGDGLLGQDVLTACVLVLGESRLAAVCGSP
jgi:hypothetical protein